jgi:hypothetical protein
MKYQNIVTYLVWSTTAECCMPTFIVIYSLFITNEAEPKYRLHNQLKYELKFNRNNLLQFKYIFSINILRLK